MFFLKIPSLVAVNMAGNSPWGVDDWTMIATKRPSSRPSGLLLRAKAAVSRHRWPLHRLTRKSERCRNVHVIRMKRAKLTYHILFRRLDCMKIHIFPPLTFLIMFMLRLLYLLTSNTWKSCNSSQITSLLLKVYWLCMFIQGQTTDK